MWFERAKESLQAQFPGQLVLHARDIAKILGMSERVIADLMLRRRLPFQVKTIGRTRCVDIFQVAEWLSSDVTLVDDVSSGLPPKLAPKVSGPGTALTKPARTVRQVQIEDVDARVVATSPTLEPEFGPFAQAILQRRKADVRRLQGFAVALPGMDDLAFMLEVLDEMVFGSPLARLTYKVSFGNLAGLERGLWANKSARYFENEQAAAKFVYLRAKDILSGNGSGRAQLKVELDDRVVFWCVYSAEAGLQVIENELQVPLAEFNA